jgi:DNA excision repair protein ERCC-3
MEQLKHTLDRANGALQEFTQLAAGSDELKEWAMNEITKYALSIRASKIDKDELENFFNYPYCILQGKHEGEAYLAIPKFIDAHFGWLHKVTPSFNIFLVNRYVDWLGELPQALKNELKFADPLDVHLEGDYLVGPDAKKVREKFGHFIKKVEADGRLLVDKSRYFDMLAALIKDGILPFIPRPVDRQDLVEGRKCDFELRDYQQEAWKTFLQYSNIGAFFPPSTGKTFLALWAMTHIKGPHLVVVPTRLLIEQWKERIALYTDLRPDEYDIMTYYAGIKSDKHYKLKIIDEVHHLPADEFSKLVAVKSDYIIGLSATPQREDEKEEYIFALTGKPVGLAWETFKQLGIIQSPPLHVWIVKSEAERIEQLGELLRHEQKTIIFCDSIALGESVAKKFDLPHIHGSSKERLAKIKDAICSVVSRVGDEGISLPDISRIIEISWLHGSRRQELQRFTRLLHGQGTQGEAHIIMTGQEYETDHKRLFSIMDKGFKIVLHRQGMEDKTIASTHKMDRKTEPRRSQPRPVRTSPPKVERSIQPNEFELSHPMLSLPGVQKKLSTCSKAERLIIRVLYERADKAMTKEDIWNLVGIGRAKDFANMEKLTNLKLIRKVGKTYQAI